MANRTKKGNVTAAARKKHGKKFPVFDAKSARSALKLRGHAKSKSAIISKVSRWASKSGNSAIKAAVKRARKADAKK
jgi:hypothetical protein